MGQEFKNVAIIGAGASGCICAYLLLKENVKVTIFDSGSPLRTLLPTGGGRCNLAHSEFDFKELAKNYPRGEKFLYSVFSKFSTSDTLSLFDEMGIKTHTEEDGRIFPISNSSKDVRNKILSKIKKADFINESVNSVELINDSYKIRTNKGEYLFPNVVVAIGGGKTLNGLDKHTVIPFAPSLVGLNSDIKFPSGVALNGVFSKNIEEYGDILFTHFGISGPLVFKMSSLYAIKKFPYKLTFDLYPKEFNLQQTIESNPHKDFKNVLSEIFPASLADWICKDLGTVKCKFIDGKMRDFVLNKIHNFEIEITGTNKGGETVTAGGYDLDEINPKTMESKLYPNLYIIGETLNIDGFCGGYNLQNAWSTAYVAANGIIEK